MPEKIGLLKHHLPSFLVEYAKLYSIVSLGVHELTEQECLSHYNAVFYGIEVILDEKVAQIEKAAKAKAATAGIQQTVAALTKPSEE